MKRSLLLPIVIFIGILNVARFNNPPNGRTGAPGDGLCTDCHSPGNPNNYTGNVSLSGLPATVMAGNSYNLTVTVNNTNQTAVRGGFQMTVLDESNNAIGNLNSPGAGSVVTPSAGRQYHEHNPGKNFSGGLASWTVRWTAPSGPDNETISFYMAGNITNGNGSTSGDFVVTNVATTTLDAPAPTLEISIVSSQNVLCNGDATGSATAEASGGTPPYDYLWSTGHPTATASGIPAGFHSVTVTDADFNTASTNVTITEPPALTLQIVNQKDVSCPGGSDGEATVNAAGGTPPYTYSWSSGASGPTQGNLPAGVYQVTVFDLNNCSTSIPVIIDEPDPMIIDVVTIDPTCYGSANGSITVTVLQNGVPPYRFKWEDGLEEVGTFSMRNKLEAGNYTVTITDNNQCQDLAFASLSVDSIMVSLDSLRSPVCHGDSNAIVFLSASNTSGPYLFKWPDGVQSSSRNDLAAGNYIVTVSDGNMCEKEYALEIPETDSLILDLDITPIKCTNASGGSISAVVSGGVPPYSYIWSTDDTTSMISGLGEGSYSVTVTDRHGCQVDSAVVFNIANVQATIDTLVKASCAGISDGQAVLSAAGGRGPYIYQWSDGGSGSMRMDLYPDSIYTVIVMDQDSCMDLITVFVEWMDTEAPIYTLDQPTVHYLGTDGITILDLFQTKFSTSDNCSDTVFVNTNLFTADCQFHGDTISQWVILTDTSGNMDSFEWKAIVLDTMPPTMHCMADTSISSCAPFHYTPPTAADNCGIASIELVEGPESGEVFPAGEILVRYKATDNSGLETHCEFIVTNSIDISVNATVDHPSCPGYSDGSVTVDVTGGTPPYNVEIQPESPLDSLKAGTYVVEVVDANQCVAVDTIEVIDPPMIQIQVDSIRTSSDDVPDGAVFVTVTGGQGGLNYEWFRANDTIPFADTEDIEDVPGGQYTLLVTDSAGCQKWIIVDVPIMTSAGHLGEFVVGIYPNPVQDNLVIETQASLYDVTIYSFDGSVAKQEFLKTGNSVVNLEKLPAGMFLLELSIKGQRPYRSTILKVNN